MIEKVVRRRTLEPVETDKENKKRERQEKH